MQFSYANALHFARNQCPNVLKLIVHRILTLTIFDNSPNKRKCANLKGGGGQKLKAIMSDIFNQT